MQQEDTSVITINETDVVSIRRADLRKQYMQIAYTILVLSLIGFIAILLVYVTEPMSSPRALSSEIPLRYRL